MALDATAHPEAIAETIEGIWYEDTHVLEFSAVHTDTILLTFTGIMSQEHARETTDRALGALGAYVHLSA